MRLAEPLQKRPPDAARPVPLPLGDHPLERRPAEVAQLLGTARVRVVLDRLAHVRRQLQMEKSGCMYGRVFFSNQPNVKQHLCERREAFAPAT